MDTDIILEMINPDSYQGVRPWVTLEVKCKMNTKIWKVKFGDWTTVRVTANNPLEAIRKAISQRRRYDSTYQNRIQDIDLVEKLEECDYE